MIYSIDTLTYNSPISPFCNRRAILINTRNYGAVIAELVHIVQSKGAAGKKDTSNNSMTPRGAVVYHIPYSISPTYCTAWIRLYVTHHYEIDPYVSKLGLFAIRYRTYTVDPTQRLDVSFL